MINLEETYDKIYRYCFMKLHNSQIAEDITQETFLHYFNVLGTRKIENWNAYLYRIAGNLCADYYRRQPVDFLEDSEISGENICEQSEVRMALEQAMETLPQVEREILFLRYTNDIPIHEVAAISDSIYFLMAFVLLVLTAMEYKKYFTYIGELRWN